MRILSPRFESQNLKQEGDNLNEQRHLKILNSENQNR